MVSSQEGTTNWTTQGTRPVCDSSSSMTALSAARLFTTWSAPWVASGEARFRLFSSSISARGPPSWMKRSRSSGYFSKCSTSCRQPERMTPSRFRALSIFSSRWISSVICRCLRCSSSFATWLSPWSTEVMVSSLPRRRSERCAGTRAIRSWNHLSRKSFAGSLGSLWVEATPKNLAVLELLAALYRLESCRWRERRLSSEAGVLIGPRALTGCELNGGSRSRTPCSCVVRACSTACVTPSRSSEGLRTSDSGRLVCQVVLSVSWLFCSH